jgi:tetratricopeptide (TPR) repeat protein
VLAARGDRERAEMVLARELERFPEDSRLRFAQLGLAGEAGAGVELTSLLRVVVAQVTSGRAREVREVVDATTQVPEALSILRELGTKVPRGLSSVLTRLGWRQARDHVEMEDRWTQMLAEARDLTEQRQFGEAAKRLLSIDDASIVGAHLEDLARAWVEADEPEAAAEFAHRALEVVATPALWEALIDALEQHEDVEGARSAADTAVQQYPTHAGLLRRQALIAASTLPPEEASFVVEQALNDAGPQLELLQLYADLLRQASRPVEALSVLEQAGRRAPNDPGLQLALGDAYRELDRAAEAGAVYLRVIELTGDEQASPVLDGLHWAVDALLDEDKPAAVLEMLDRGEGTGLPTSVRARRPEALRILGRFEEAEEAADSFLGDVSDAGELEDHYHAWLLATRGDARMQLGRPQEATRDFEAAMDGHVYPWAAARRITALSYLERYDEVVPLLEKQFPLDGAPHGWEGWAVRARAAIALELWDLAGGIALLTRYPDEPNRDLMGALRLRRGEVYIAVDLLTEGADAEPSSWNLLDAGVALMLTGQGVEGRTYLKRAISRRVLEPPIDRPRTAWAEVLGGDVDEGLASLAAAWDHEAWQLWRPFHVLALEVAGRDDEAAALVPVLETSFDVLPYPPRRTGLARETQWWLRTLRRLDRVPPHAAEALNDMLSSYASGDTIEG